MTGDDSEDSGDDTDDTFVPRDGEASASTSPGGSESAARTNQVGSEEPTEVSVNNFDLQNLNLNVNNNTDEMAGIQRGFENQDQATGIKPPGKTRGRKRKAKAAARKADQIATKEVVQVENDDDDDDDDSDTPTITAAYPAPARCMLPPPASAGVIYGSSIPRNKRRGAKPAKKPAPKSAAVKEPTGAFESNVARSLAGSSQTLLDPSSRRRRTTGSPTRGGPVGKANETPGLEGLSEEEAREYLAAEEELKKMEKTRAGIAKALEQDDSESRYANFMADGGYQGILDRFLGKRPPRPDDARW